MSTHSEIFDHCLSWSFLVNFWSLEIQSFAIFRKGNIALQVKVLILDTFRKEAILQLKKY